MNWATIREAIRDAVVSASGIGDARVAWLGTTASGVWRDTPFVDLVLRAPQAIGVDEIRHTFDAGGDVIVPSLTGPRKFTVSINVETDTQVDGSESVGALASTIRTRLRRPSIRSALRAAEVALVEIMPTVQSDYNTQGRLASKSITDVVFASAEADIDTTDAGDYIASVDIVSNTIDDVNGTPIADQVHIVVGP